MNIEFITWVDAESQGAGWTHADESMKIASSELPTVYSVGFVLFEGKNHLTLMHTDGGDEKILAIKIPTSWIVKREVIKTIAKDKKVSSTNVSRSRKLEK